MFTIKLYFQKYLNVISNYIEFIENFLSKLFSPQSIDDYIMNPDPQMKPLPHLNL